VRRQGGETAVRAIGCQRPEAIASGKHRTMVFPAAAAAGRNAVAPRQKHGQSQPCTRQDEQQTGSKTAHEQKDITTSHRFVMTTDTRRTALP
jgi:6-phosphogluconolactonase (cycloisomerase 2 family)